MFSHIVLHIYFLAKLRSSSSSVYLYNMTSLPGVVLGLDAVRDRERLLCVDSYVLYCIRTLFHVTRGSLLKNRTWRNRMLFNSHSTNSSKGQFYFYGMIRDRRKRADAAGFCDLWGTFPPGVVGFMNNVAADVEMMPAVVSSIFFLIPSPPAPFLLSKTRHLLDVTLDERLIGDSRPNKMSGGWERKSFQMTDGETLTSRLRYGGEAGRQTRVRRRLREWRWDRKRLEKRRNVGKAAEEWSGNDESLSAL